MLKVPETLDMYEARLYLMNNAKSLSINSYPLPLESGLYGNLTGVVGGYNFESEAYRGVAYASCEYPGESMFLNYTSKNPGANLYHLVLIGEVGSGDIEFMLKSQFGNTSLTPLNTPSKVYPNTPTQISYISNNASLDNAQLSYYHQQLDTLSLFLTWQLATKPAMPQYQVKLQAQLCSIE